MVTWTHVFIGLAGQGSCKCLIHPQTLLLKLQRGTCQRATKSGSTRAHLVHSCTLSGKRPQGTLKEKGRSIQLTSNHCASGEGEMAVYMRGGPTLSTLPVSTCAAAWHSFCTKGDQEPAYFAYDDGTFTPKEAGELQAKKQNLHIGPHPIPHPRAPVRVCTWEHFFQHGLQQASSETWQANGGLFCCKHLSTWPSPHMIQ